MDVLTRQDGPPALRKTISMTPDMTAVSFLQRNGSNPVHLQDDFECKIIC